MGKKDDLSTTMLDAIALANEAGGILERHPGGFWTKPGTGWLSRGVPDGPWHGSSTVNALIARGAVEVTKRAGKAEFPIEVSVTAPQHDRLSPMMRNM